RDASGTCFFFQAEDGIRDFHVTGVQTCALPIWLRREKLVEHLEAELAQLKTLPSGQHTKAVCALLSHPTYSRYLAQTKGGKLRRSEERRVGTERCRERARSRSGGMR